MDKRLKQKKSLLEKIFTFLKADVEALDTNEKQTLVDEMLPFFMPPYDPEANKGKLTSNFLSAYEKMAGYSFNKRHEYVEILIAEGIVDHVQRKAKTSLNKLITEGTGSIFSPLMAWSTIKDGIITNLMLPTIEHGFDPKNFHEVVFLSNLSNIIDGIPYDSLKICPLCDGYFLNLTKRKKEYCSPHCTWRAIAQRKIGELKKHPRKYKAYLKKQRKIMKRKYEEKRKAEFGPNVKVRRRKEG
jgi:hypothetical protein